MPDNKGYLDSEKTPTWKIVLSNAIVLAVILALLVLCSKL